MQQAITEGVEAGKQAIREQEAHLGEHVNGWQVALDLGRYGTKYAYRAAWTFFGVGGNLIEDACYPLATTDGNGEPLDSAHRYTLHFDRDQLPPVNAFWSLTMYDAESYLVANADRPLHARRPQRTHLRRRRLAHSLHPERQARRLDRGELATHPERRPLQGRAQALLAQARGRARELAAATDPARRLDQDSPGRSLSGFQGHLRSRVGCLLSVERGNTVRTEWLCCGVVNERADTKRTHQKRHARRLATHLAGSQTARFAGETESRVIARVRA